MENLQRKKEEKRLSDVYNMIGDVIDEIAYIM